MRRIGFAIAMTLTILWWDRSFRIAPRPSRSRDPNIAALKGANLLQDIACRRVWRCGPYGWAGALFAG